MAEPSEIVREALLEAALGEPGGAPAVEQVRAARIEPAPGQPTGLHRHPCDVVGYVAAGTICCRPARTS
jgi:quercetin dioxygenase-like cupin family protein